MPAHALISQTIASLINGVSQQPHELRLASQNQAQLNCLSDAVRGVLKRPPTRHVSELIIDGILGGPGSGGELPVGDALTGDAFYHIINEGVGNQYLVMIWDSVLRVFGLDDGLERTVEFGVGDGSPTDGTELFYLASENPRDDFAAVSTADYTVITNKTTMVEVGDALTPDGRVSEFTWVVVADSAGYAMQINITADGATITTSATSVGTAYATSQAMRDALLANGALTALGWQFTLLSRDTVYGLKVEPSAGSPPTKVVSSDNFTNHIAKLIFQTAERFSDLPAISQEGTIIEVSGDETNPFDAYYVYFNADESIWEEIAKPGDDYAFDPETMPIVLARTPDGTHDFQLSRPEWPGREAGDTTTNPDPSVIGREIKDVVVHSDRLCLIAGDSVLCSEASKANWFNFFKTTVATRVDSDPLDLAAASSRVNLLDYAVPFQKSLALFSVVGQYQGILTSGDARLTEGSGRVEEIGAFAASQKARPATVDNAIYIPVDRGIHTGVYEFKVTQEDGGAVDEITAHVTTYLPGEVFHMATAPGEGLVVLLSDDEPNKLYPYRSFSQEKTKLMSSWSTWELSTADVIRYAGFIDSILYIVVERADGLFLEMMNFRDTQTLDVPHIVHLDSLVLLDGAYDSATDTTTWLLPYDQNDLDGTFRAVLAEEAAFGNSLAQLVPGLDVSVPGEAFALGDYSEGTVALGSEYDSYLEISQWHLKERSDVSVSPITSGRLQVRNGRVLLSETGSLIVEVTADGDSETYSYPFTGVAVGVSELGPILPQDAVHSFDISGENRSVHVVFRSRSFLPWAVTGLELEGIISRRSDRA